MANKRDKREKEKLRLARHKKLKADLEKLKEEKKIKDEEDAILAVEEAKK